MQATALTDALADEHGEDRHDDERSVCVLILIVKLGKRRKMANGKTVTTAARPKAFNALDLSGTQDHSDHGR